MLCSVRRYGTGLSMARFGISVFPSWIRLAGSLTVAPGWLGASTGLAGWCCVLSRFAAVSALAEAIDVVHVKGELPSSRQT